MRGGGDGRVVWAYRGVDLVCGVWGSDVYFKWDEEKRVWGM